MRYCARCITPDTRPHVVLDGEGVCNACRAHETKPAIDWAARAAAFVDVVAHSRARSTGYDCVIPVSGGKDSTWQVVTCLEYGLNPLAVTWKTPARTDLGARNLDNLIALGVDHIDYQINPKVERVFMLEAFRRYGSTAIPMHMAIFNIPVTIAVRFGIPLVVWGENSAFEYGGTEDERTGFCMDGRWLQRYGVTHGTTSADWVSDELSARALTPYRGLGEAELAAAGVTGVFLGYYFQWDPERSLAVARRHGFRSRAEGPKTGYYDYADIDDEFISIHHYLKWYKFGFTRLFDNLSLEIRHGRMSRDQAIAIVRARGDERPDADIDALCRFAGITRNTFFEIAETFRNAAVWTRRDCCWVIDDFLVTDWNWS